MRHDMRHHRAAVAALIKSGDTAALGQYVDFASVSEDAVPVTGNLAADSVLLYYSDMAKKLGVTIESEVSVFHGLPVTDADFCVILGNLLENAVEA